MLAMLLLSNAGLSDDQIVADYHECAALSNAAVVLMTPTPTIPVRVPSGPVLCGLPVLLVTC
jgi:hypothetical protein